MRFTRRSLIRGLVATLGLVPPSASTALGGRVRDVAWAPARDAGDPEPAALSQSELEDLLAFGEVLVEGRALSPVERNHLSDHIAARLTQGSGYYLSLYHTTVQLINQSAGVRFSSLDVSQRVELVRRHRLAARDVRPGESVGPSPEDARAVRTRAVPDLIAGYYGSPIGWSVVGHTVFPGQCGDLTRYTSPER